MLKDGKLQEDPQINIVENEQLKIEIGNHYRDYQTKWEHILDQQNDLLEKMSDVSEGRMNEEVLEEFQLGNQRVKDEIVGLQFDLQKELNEASDIRLYKDFIDFQNEVFTKAIPKFIEVDNRLVSESKFIIETIEETNQTLEMREDEIEVLQKELEDKAEELSELSQESKTLLQQAGLELKKDANKQKELEDNLKIEKQKTQVLEDKVFGLEEQKQGMEQSLMGTEDTDVPERQFQQSRQTLLDRYIARQQREEPEFIGEVVERDI
tara:strand:+ start:6 stop:803 length:798 start_codon:yes stop_codon:yes gene_type:complete